MAYPVSVSTTPRSLRARRSRFVHEAMFYEGEDDFIEQVLPFVQRRRSRPANRCSSRSARHARAGCAPSSGATRQRVQFAEMETLGRNPARIISAWHDFVTAHEGAGRPLRGIGEPIWPGRSEPELAECHRHEALLNVAFDDGPPWWLLCPYDASALADDVLAEARRTHPALRERGEARASAGSRARSRASPSAGCCRSRPGRCTSTRSASSDLAQVRRLVSETRRGAAAPAGALAELVLCVSELAANSVLHGAGPGSCASGVDDGTSRARCAIAERMRERLTGRLRPAIDALHGPGSLVRRTAVRSRADPLAGRTAPWCGCG